MGVLILWSVLTGCSNPTTDLAPDQLQQFSMSSALTGTTYPIYVVLPKGYQAGQRYPTVYVLDGDDGLTSGEQTYVTTAGLVEKAAANYRSEGAVVVAIGSAGQRVRDFTPTASDGFDGDGGGAENFAQFLKQELIPKIEQSFAVDTSAQHRIFIGHSLGGSMGGYLFAQHPDVFFNYLLLSPAFWWDDGVLMRQEESRREQNKARPSLVYVGCGEFEESIVILAQEWHLRLKRYYPQCRSAFYRVSNSSHLSSAFANLERGMDFYFMNR